ncbi:MAG: hypothetical protein AB7P02_20775 [Alphaproteobacteria bacterium]
MICAGPLLWALHFAFVYATHAGICASGGRIGLAAGEAMPWLLVPATAVVLAALAALAVSPRLLDRLQAATEIDEQGEFLTSVGRLLAALALFGVAASAIGILALPACEPTR